MKKLLPLILLCSCVDFTDGPHFYVDEELKGSLSAFFEQASARNVVIYKNNLIVVVGDLSSTGLCSNYRGGATITINRKVFPLDSLALDYILFHEMGHYMGRVHNNSFSIMNPNKYAGDFHNDSTKRVELIDELFSSL